MIKGSHHRRSTILKMHRPKTKQEKINISKAREKFYKDGGHPWNYGLSMKTDKRVAKYAKTQRGRINYWQLGNKNPSKRPEIKMKISKNRKGKMDCHGELNPFYGHKHTKLTKQNHSIFMKKFLKTHPEKLAQITKMAFENNKKINKKGTKPERLIWSILDENKIKYERNHSMIDVRTQPDAFVSPRLCIYADGDFYHGNPKFFKMKNLSLIQIHNKSNDRRINRDLRSNGYIVLRFWECDINNNLPKVAQKIQDTIAQCYG